MGITLFTAEIKNNNFYCGISKDGWDTVQHSMTPSIRLNRGGITTIFKAKGKAYIQMLSTEVYSVQIFDEWPLI